MLIVAITFVATQTFPRGAPAQPIGPIDASGDASPTGTAPTVTTTSSIGPTLVQTESPTPAAAEVTPRRSFTMAFTGDVLIHAGVRRAAAAHAQETDREFDFRPIFEPISPVLAGVDWAVCHMEVTLAADNSALSGFPRFRAPGDLAGDLADVGYDACSTASNHSLDFGFAGVTETIEVMESAGLRHTGTARSEGEEWTSRWYDIAQTDVAHLSYSYGFNGYQIPDDQPWAVRQIDSDRILADAAVAREAGAEFVVVSLHWGWEYRHDLSTQQQELGPLLVSSPDIDLLVGHHAHVVQPIERIDGEWVVYGLGNLVSNQTQRTRRDELLVIAEVEERDNGTFHVAELTAVPLFLDSTTMTVYPSGPAFRQDGMSAGLQAELDASFERVRAVVEAGAGYERLHLMG